ncbi:MAG: serine hydrolase [Polyangiaceae bacterium]|nr:serine hydrolase [Polyangiaceae bacterium]
MRAVWLCALGLLACARPAPPCPPVPTCPSAVALAPPAPASAATVGVPPPATKPAPPPREKPTARLFDDALVEGGFLPRGDAFELGLDGAALDQLVTEAEATKSDALIVLKNGRVVAERYFGQKRGPIETMSITKSITALAVVMLLESGKLASLDEPISRFIPEFGAAPRSQVTVRHLLTQTSGLSHGKDAKRLNAQKDRTAFARRATVVDAPGTVFSYNNEATQLLSVVVEKAAGKSVDAYLDEVLFRPLQIRGWQWDRDGGGNVQTYYGLALEARHLARIGQLLLDRGSFQGRALISKEGVAKLHAPSDKSPYYGLLWWIRYQRVVHELDPSLASRPGLAALVGKSFGSPEALWLEAGAQLSRAERDELGGLAAAGGKLSRERPDHPVGLYADGSLGQRLAVFGEDHLVVVRQRRRRPAAEESEALSFPAMLKLAYALTPR